ncbi:MAG: CotH kinase family protein [Alloprevotella sp.]|nr:CotH kinase family protein [Alloprevotella sp.]
MKKLLPLFLFLFCSAFPLAAQTLTYAEGDSLFLYLQGGRLDVFPGNILRQAVESNDSIRLTLLNDSVVAYPLSEVERCETSRPQDLPVFTSFKFNNKYNDQVYTDVQAELVSDTLVQATVGAIGKRLTPSFQLNDAGAKAYVEGRLQESKVSRLRFDPEVVYTLAYDGWRECSYRKLQDEEWQIPGGERTRVTLTADMLSTNAPSNYEETEGLDKVLDGNLNTFFHSTWGSGSYEKLPLNEYPYVEINLPEALENISFYYVTRPDANRVPTAWSIQVSADGNTWSEVASFTEGLPTAMSAPYTSPDIALGGAYSHLRLVQTGASYKNYLCLAELELYSVTPAEGADSVLVHPAVYAFDWHPYGRTVRAHVDWLTDHATQVPRIDINVEGGQMISSKEVYLRAEILIDGAGVFPDFADSVNIKGRGNISWQGTGGKSPYRLKFDAKKKPFGLTAGKSWVLLANNQSGSMMTNAVAMKVAQMAGTVAANDIIPVELYLNGEYRGSYNFTQHVGLSNNSVDLDDDTNAIFLELDSYYDEAYKFRDASYALPVNIKEPDFTENYNEDRFNLIQDDFNELTSLALTGTDAYTDKLDIDQFVRYMFVNNYVLNMELNHPKSTFVYREDILALHCPYVFGPVWDFDWAYGYDGTGSYCTSGYSKNFIEQGSSRSGARFFNAAYNNSEAVQRATYNLWTTFRAEHEQELIEYIDDYLAYAKPSFLHNAERWSDGTGYDTYATNMKNWLQQRSNYIYRNLTAYDLTQPMAIALGDVNLDGAITVADAVCVVNHLLDMENETFEEEQADADKSGSITVNDAVHIVALALRQPTLTTRHLQLPAAEAALSMSAFALRPGEETTLPVSFKVEAGQYAAAQFDVLLPEGMTLETVRLPEEWEGHTVSFQSLDDGRWRVAVWGVLANPLPVGEAAMELTLTASRLIPSRERVVSIEAATLTNVQGEDLRLSPRSAKFQMETTGLSPVEAVSVEGGEALLLDSATPVDVPVYTLDGRLFRTLHLSAGRTRISLPAGLYIVNHQKVLIR